MDIFHESKNVLAQNNVEVEEDKLPATSKVTTTPEEASYNIKDLTPLDFNSADEIRQTMKAILSGKTPQQIIDENKVDTKDYTDHDMKTEINSNDITTALKQIDKKKSASTVVDGKNLKPKINAGKKRPGRPPKAGTSKKVKKSSVSALYLGKLSNVVSFKQRHRYPFGSESEDSLLYL